MSAPLFGKISRGLSARGPEGLEKFIDKAASDLAQVARQLDEFDGGTSNTDAASAAIDKMRTFARMQSLGLGGADLGQMRGMCGSNGTSSTNSGGCDSSASSFDPFAQNSCSAGNAGALSSSGADAELQALSEAGGAGGYFEDRVFGLMIKIVEDFQKKIEERLQKLEKAAKEAEAKKEQGGGGGGGEGGKEGGQESRNIEFEKIKFDMQKLSQMQQAMSNILNTMDELAKSAIRHIKAG